MAKHRQFGKHFNNLDEVCCLDVEPDNLYTCSLNDGHFGDHSAYGGHRINPVEHRMSWPQAVTQQEIDDALASIREAVTRGLRRTP